MTSTRVLQLLPSCSYACNTKQNAPFPSSTFKRVVPWSFSNTPLKNLYTRTMLKSVCSSIHEPVASPSVSELSSQDQWATFESSVTGEWEGSTATFDSAGVPQELDQYYVPQDYRDWGVHLYNWQTQCSMLANEHELRYAVKRLMPTVGCEADATAFIDEETRALAALDGSLCPAQTYLPEGSFNSGPRSLSEKGATTARVEHCLALPSEPRKRLRVVQLLKLSEGTWQVASLELHSERYEGPYTGGKELAGCGGGIPAFAQEPAVTPSQVGAPWRSWEGRYLRFESDGKVAEDSSTADSPRLKSGDEDAGVVCLPLGAWSRVKIEGETAFFEAGCVSESGCRAVSSRSYINGHLSQSELGRESNQT